MAEFAGFSFGKLAGRFYMTDVVCEIMVHMSGLAGDLDYKLDLLKCIAA